jgi:hypothetical protein
MKLLKIVSADDGKHKYEAQFDNGKNVKFGAKGMNDYTRTHDKNQRERYRERHAKDLAGDYTKPGYLSWYILWGESTDMKENIREYKNKFHL